MNGITIDRTGAIFTFMRPNRRPVQCFVGAKEAAAIDLDKLREAGWRVVDARGKTPAEAVRGAGR